jgi:DNA repair photolyase
VVVKLTILPGISDRPEQLREVVRAAREAGATGVWTNILFLKPLRWQVSALAKELGVADRRTQPVEPMPEPEQLALAV